MCSPFPETVSSNSEKLFVRNAKRCLLTPRLTTIASNKDLLYGQVLPSSDLSCFWQVAPTPQAHT